MIKPDLRLSHDTRLICSIRLAGAFSLHASLQLRKFAAGEMRYDVLVIAAVAGVVYANDPAPVAFDAGEWYVYDYALRYPIRPHVVESRKGLSRCS